ncbi:MAG: hypothetical protein GWQ05_05715 [Verrucomicrobiaceae bacterium]|nr:hypothetical protein [Verrucomicrobiaceae bacterium]NCF90442.1 hypothetical protein [Verrucomicrobiaceae bacterium]
MQHPVRTKKGLFGQRDSRALSELYQCYAGPLYSYAFKILANHEDAEEVLQDTFRSTFSFQRKGRFRQSVTACSVA